MEKDVFMKEMSLIMEIKNSIARWLFSSIVEQFASSSNVQSLSKEISELSSENESLRNELKEIKDYVMNMHNVNFINYKYAVNNFKDLTDGVMSLFRKNTKLRCLYMDLLSCRINQYDFDETMKDFVIDEKGRLLAGEIKDFINNQVSCINYIVMMDCDNCSYKDCIIYPKEGEDFDSDKHDTIDDGYIIKEVLRLGYVFPGGYSKKAKVTLK